MDEVLEKYGLETDLFDVEYYENENFIKLSEHIKNNIRKNRIFAITGIIGSGKTTALMKIAESLNENGDIIVSTNFMISSEKLNFNTIICGLISDICETIDVNLPNTSKLYDSKEKKLAKLIQQAKSDIVLFIDDAHDLNFETFHSLRKLNIIAKSSKRSLSVVLLGHPRLKFELMKPEMQEIGNRIKYISMNGIEGKEREFFEWMMKECMKNGTKIQDIFTDEAVNFIVSRFRTPLHMQHFISRAMEEAFLAGIKPINLEMVTHVVSRDLDSKISILTRQGYHPKKFADAVGITLKETFLFHQNKLPPQRTKDIEEQIYQLGVLARA